MRLNIEYDFNKIHRQLDTVKLNTLDLGLAIRVWKDSNYFCPVDTGWMIESSYVDRHTDPITVNWITPYAKKVYFASEHGLRIHQRPEGNPNAREQWFEAARGEFYDEWKKELVEDILND